MDDERPDTLRERAAASAAEGELVSKLFAFLSDWVAYYEASRGKSDALELSQEIVRQAGEKNGALVSHAMAGLAATAYEERRVRDRVFADPDLFGEPAWDILLDVATSEWRGERLNVSAACVGSGVPMTTALRWLKALDDRGLVRRQEDEEDGRRVYVRLTAKGAATIARYFAELAQIKDEPKD